MSNKAKDRFPQFEDIEITVKTKVGKTGEDAYRGIHDIMKIARSVGISVKKVSTEFNGDVISVEYKEQ